MIMGPRNDKPPFSAPFYPVSVKADAEANTKGLNINSNISFSFMPKYGLHYELQHSISTYQHTIDCEADYLCN